MRGYFSLHVSEDIFDFRVRRYHVCLSVTEFADKSEIEQRTVFSTDDSSLRKRKKLKIKSSFKTFYEIGTNTEINIMIKNETKVKGKMKWLWSLDFVPQSRIVGVDNKWSLFTWSDRRGKSSPYFLLKSKCLSIASTDTPTTCTYVHEKCTGE